MFKVPNDVDWEVEGEFVVLPLVLLISPVVLL